ncbi:MAG: DUF4384 domain-containing protein [Desulfomicrobium sp.]
MLLMRLAGITSLLVLVLFTSAVDPALYAQARGVQVKPDSEKRSIIQEVDGYAYLSESLSLKKIRAEAFANAKRQALENAESRLHSFTQVKNFQVDYDLVLSKSEGSVTVLEQKDLGIEPDNRYHVWIKAQVDYSLHPKQQEEQVEVVPASGPLTVRVWTDKKHYFAGDMLVVYIQGNRDFYARVIDVTATGEVIQLLPNAYQSEHFFKGGVAYRIPGEDAGFNLQVTPPFGRDQIIVYASERPLGQASVQPVGNGFSQFRGTTQELGMKLRGLQINAAKQGEGAEFYEASWDVETSNQ